MLSRFASTSRALLRQSATAHANWATAAPRALGAQQRWNSTLTAEEEKVASAAKAHAISEVDRETEEELSLLPNLGLSDWKRAFPIGLILAIPALENEWFILNEEAQLGACFLLFVTTAYQAAGDATGEFFDEKGKAIMAEHNAIEDQQIQAAMNLIEAHKKRLFVVEDQKTIYNSQVEIRDVIHKISINSFKNKTRDNVAFMLDTIAQREQAGLNRARNGLVTQATEHVTKEFSADKKAKKAAMDQALAVIADPNANVTNDTIGNMYRTFLSGRGSDMKSHMGKTIKLTAEEMQQNEEDFLALKRQMGYVFDMDTLKRATGFDEEQVMAVVQEQFPGMTRETLDATANIEGNAASFVFGASAVDKN